MKRRDLFRAGIVLGGTYALTGHRALAANETVNRLTPPAKGKIPVAFLISDGAVVIDFAGPWEVFQDVMLVERRWPDDDRMPFQTYTVSASAKPIRASGGMKIVPDYTFDNAPQPKVIVIPAQSDPTPAVLEWLRKASATADVTMSVCTGAFLLAQSGLLDGQAATTHHTAYRGFEKAFPKVTLKRGARFVEGPKTASAGGLTSGIDLAMHVVERYFGREVAEKTAFYMEYQSTGWKDNTATANDIYAKQTIAPGHAEDPVCGMEVEKGEFKADYKGTIYYFCMDSCKRQFVRAPEDFVGPGSADRKKSM
jgi:putative intracellular protease/amidase/YHS domain-containing protein